MERTHLILLPGTLCDDRLWFHQIENLNDIASIEVGDLTKDVSIGNMVDRVLKDAPAGFALAGLSLGGIVASEIIRRAPERVKRLALLDTTYLPPLPDQIDTWKQWLSMTEQGKFTEITPKYLLPSIIHPDRSEDLELTGMIIDMSVTVGEQAFSR